MPNPRLDQALVSRGLARSRTHASRLIADGFVRVGGQQQLKPSLRVADDDEVTVDALDHYVSRAAHKLIAALDEPAFAIGGADSDGQVTTQLAGRTCLDVGASTGGFTQVLLERGAEHVVALDVGHAQLHPLVRSDPRVTVIEGVNARYLTGEDLDALMRTARPDDAPAAADISLVVADLSFISLTHVLQPLRDTVSAEADFVLLIKPQFEVGRTGVKEGIVLDPTLIRDAIDRVLWSAWDAGLGVVGIIDSPILGTHGNREFVAVFRPSAGDPSQWSETLDHLVRGGRQA